MEMWHTLAIMCSKKW